MTLQEWITLIVAVLGVLHGPATSAIIAKFTGSKGKP